MGMLEILYLYCAHLMPNTALTADCMVELKWCAIAAEKEYPERSFEERVDNCSESIGFEWKEPDYERIKRSYTTG